MRPGHNVRCTGRKDGKTTRCGLGRGERAWTGWRMRWSNGTIPNLGLPCPRCGGDVERVEPS